MAVTTTRQAGAPFRPRLGSHGWRRVRLRQPREQKIGDNPREVTVFGSGQVRASQDTLTAEVGIEFTAPDVSVAMNQTNDRQQAVINALVGAGVDRKDISTTEVSLQPQYEQPGGTASPGTVPTNSIRVKIHPTDSGVTGAGRHCRHRRRRHPDQFGQLLDRG